MHSEGPAETRLRLEKFLKGPERSFAFDVNCGVEDRIKYIYSIVFPGMEVVRFYLNFLIARIARFIDYSPVKVFLYRLTGMNIGKGVFISPDVILDPHFPSLISLEDYCILGWGAKLFVHEYSEHCYRIGRIVVKNGANIGGYATIRGGVTIGKMAEVPYGSIIYKDVPDHAKPSQLILTRGY